MTRFVGSYPRAREGNLFVAVSDISAGKNHQTANTNLASIYMSHSGITFSVLVINRFHRLIMYSKVYSWLCVGVDYEPPAVSMIWSYESFIFNFFWLKVLKFGLLELICKPITGFSDASKWPYLANTDEWLLWVSSLLLQVSDLVVCCKFYPPFSSTITKIINLWYIIYSLYFTN